MRLDTRTIHHIIATTLDNVNARRPIQQGKRERQRRRKSATEKKKMSAPSTASFFLFSSVLLFSLSTVGAKRKKKLTVPILQPHTHTHYIPLASGNKKKKKVPDSGIRTKSSAMFCFFFSLLPLSLSS